MLKRDKYRDLPEEFHRFIVNPHNLIERGIP